ncbi:MAG: ABC transporter substrate-binding protein [Thermoleophilia bacterium]
MKLHIKLMSVFLFFLLLISGCSTEANLQSQPHETGYPLNVTDDAGRTVAIEKNPERLVSLAPSNTEIVFALGLEERLVGDTEFCNYPAAAAQKDKVGGTTGKTISLEKIVSLKPDLVLASNLSGKDLISQLEAQQIPVIVLYPKSLDQIMENIKKVGSLSGRASEADELVGALKQQMEQVEARAEATSHRPRVLFEIDATDPSRVFTAGPGSFANEMISAAGGSNIAATATGPWPTLSLEEIVAADPEVVISTHPGGALSPEEVADRPGWAGISAVKNRAIYTVDNDMVSRPGPRIVEGLAAIANILHPEN